jgi:hypothetical protein
MRAMILWFLVGMAACGHQRPGIRESDAGKALGDLDYERVARALERQGRHLEASFYYEAALRNGEDEARILPPLIVSQIRAERLRAAKQSIARLRAIRGNPEHLAALLDLISRYTPALAGEAAEEGER